MSTADWYRRHLNPTQPPAPVGPPAMQPPFMHVAQPPVPGAPVPPVYQNVRGGFVAGADGKVDVVASASTWQGGKGNADVQNCPNCGSAAYYSPTAQGAGIANRDAGKYMRQCYECGYPVVQFGSVGGPGESAELIG